MYFYIKGKYIIWLVYKILLYLSKHGIQQLGKIISLKRKKKNLMLMP